MKIKNIFLKNILLVLSIFFFTFFTGATQLFAVGLPPPPGGYTPGTELDPDCFPGLADCIVTAGTIAGGSNTQVQYNDGGLLGADANFTWDKTGHLLAVNGGLSVTGDILSNAFFTTRLGTGAGVINPTTGWYDVFIGYESGHNNASGYGNVSNGYHALYSNTEGDENVANGVNALYSNLSGGRNVANGSNALFANTIGEYNVAEGWYSLTSNTEGNNNIGIGASSLYNNKTGNENLGLGASVLQNNTIGNGNTAMGAATLNFNVSGNYNTGIGYESMLMNVLGGYNTAIGFYSGYNSLGSNNVFIGSNAGRYETGSNTFYLDNQNRLSTVGDKAGALLYGIFNSIPLLQTLTVNGMLGIGTPNPSSTFQIVQGTAGPGTVTVTGTTTCTGTNTQFLNTFRAGDSITITQTGETKVISVVTSDTLMTIAAAANTVGASNYTTSATANTRFVVKGNGSIFAPGLGISTGTPDALCIDSLSHEITYNSGTGDCTVSSARFKENITNLDLGLSFVESLTPRTFNYIGNLTPRVGFIAEEVVKLDPRLVFYEQDGTTVRGVRYEDMSAVLVKAVQDLDLKIENSENVSVPLIKDRIMAKEFCVSETECLNEQELRTFIQEFKNSHQMITPDPTPTPTCSDGIQNQDETGIDTGGVCGDPALTPDPVPDPIPTP